jgi:hypothetical protein
MTAMHLICHINFLVKCWIGWFNLTVDCQHRNGKYDDFKFLMLTRVQSRVSGERICQRHVIWRISDGPQMPLFTIYLSAWKPVGEDSGPRQLQVSVMACDLSLPPCGTPFWSTSGWDFLTLTLASGKQNNCSPIPPF